MRLGIIGLGFGRYVLLPAARRITGVEVSALCGTDMGRAREWARTLGVPEAFDDSRALLDANAADAILIATTPAAQPEIALEALARRVPVLLSKPLAPSLAEARAVADAAERSQTVAMMDFLFPEIPAWQRCRELVAEGAIGEVRHAVVTWLLESYDVRQGLRTWKTDAGAGGGATRFFGSHLMYNLEWLLGAVRSVRGATESARDLNLPGDTLATFLFEMHSGATVSATISNAATGASDHTWRLFGSRGALELSTSSSDFVRGFRLRATGGTNGDVTPADFAREPSEDARVPLMEAIIRRFLRAVENRVTERPSVADGVRVHLLLEACARAAGRDAVTV